MKRMKQVGRMNNVGLTMVELICTVAMLSIIGLASMGMLATVARMNHVIALQQKQAREAEVVIETLRGYLQEQKTTVTKEHENLVIQVVGSDQSQQISWTVETADGRSNLVLHIAPKEGEEVKRVLAEDLAEPTQQGFVITPYWGESTEILPDTSPDRYEITLRYQNGNQFDWVLTPRL